MKRYWVISLWGAVPLLIASYFILPAAEPVAKPQVNSPARTHKASDCRNPTNIIISKDGVESSAVAVSDWMMTLHPMPADGNGEALPMPGGGMGGGNGGGGMGGSGSGRGSGGGDGRGSGGGGGNGGGQVMAGGDGNLPPATDGGGRGMAPRGGQMNKANLNTLFPQAEQIRLLSCNGRAVSLSGSEVRDAPFCYQLQANRRGALKLNACNGSKTRLRKAALLRQITRIEVSSRVTVPEPIIGEGSVK